MREEEDFLKVCVLRRRSTAQLRARRRMAPGVLFPFRKRKKKRVSFDRKKKEKHSFSSAPCRDGSLSLAEPIPFGKISILFLSS